MQKIKRILAAILVAMTVLSCNVTGFAATKPSVYLVSKSSVSVKRGKSTTVKFVVDSNSYKMKSNRYRAILWTGVYYKSISSSSYLKNTGYMYWFSGRYNINHKLNMKKKTATGKYYLLYELLYHKKGATNSSLKNGTVNLNKWKLASYNYVLVKVK